MKSVILFKGKRTKKTIPYIQKEMWVQTYVAVNKWEQLGILANLYPTKDSQDVIESLFWGLGHPKDVVISWRATLLVDESSVLDEYTMSAAYHASQLTNSRDQEEFNKVMVSIIGEKRYKGVMQIPVPEEILQLVVKYSDKRNGDFSVESLTGEIEAGTVKWTKLLKSISVKHPTQVKARQEAERYIVARFEYYLELYAETQKIPRQCLAMSAFEDAITDGVERGIDRFYGTDILLGIAIVRMKLTLSAGLTNSIGLWLSSDLDFKKETNEAIRFAAKWVSSNLTKTGQWYTLWRSSPLRPLEEYLTILTNIEAAFNKMPVTNPLEPEPPKPEE